ncbi:MAG: hypothetical protein WBC85_06375 [Planktotalea sp.]|uniref:hypothetical protein n=1 Tax=Planktotalea sp. TaxID=2029877 RepID=UPI003C77BD46
MLASSRSNLFIGLLCVVFALGLIFVWIPLDTDSGIVEKVRGRLNIGDALAPTVAACFVLIGGALLLIVERQDPLQTALSKGHLNFLVQLLVVTIASLLVMRFAGPLAGELANQFRAEPIEYRNLRATPGWKHMGFVLGGIMLVSGLISIVERKFSKRAVLTAGFAVLVLIVVFDLPFDDLQLPPNGDV